MNTDKRKLDLHLATDIGAAPPRALLVSYVDLLDELQRRKIIRSKNNPVADLAELLVINALGLSLARKSTRGFDATDSRGNRYEIKGRRLTAQNKSRQLSFIRGLKDRKMPFDYLAGILFNDDFSVLRGCIIPVKIILSVSRHRERENAWRLVLHDSLWKLRGVIDITAKLKAAECRLLDK